MITIVFSDKIKEIYNSFEEIVKLENYNDIIYINCRNNLISSLPVLPNSLMYLYCNNNILSSLPELPNSLTQLYCDDNKLYNLPDLPNLLTHLYCSYNKLSSFPELPNTLSCLYYYNNPIHHHIKKISNGNVKTYFKYKTAVNKIGEWFLDCKYNPKFLYCKKRLIKEYEELYI
jgi:E3 ubiquitin-protein ligase IpaH7.8